jgi:hypothetical protein
VYTFAPPPEPLRAPTQFVYYLQATAETTFFPYLVAADASACFLALMAEASSTADGASLENTHNLRVVVKHSDADNVLEFPGIPANAAYSCPETWAPGTNISLFSDAMYRVVLALHNLGKNAKMEDRLKAALDAGWTKLSELAEVRAEP